MTYLARRIASLFHANVHDPLREECIVKSAEHVQSLLDEAATVERTTLTRIAGIVDGPLPAEEKLKLIEALARKEMWAEKRRAQPSRN